MKENEVSSQIFLFGCLHFLVMNGKSLKNFHANAQLKWPLKVNWIDLKLMNGQQLKFMSSFI